MNAHIVDRFLVKYLRGYPHRGQTTLFKVLRKMLRRRYVVARTSFGSWMRLDPDDYLQYEILRCGSYERETLQCISSLLSNGATYVDVGTNVGQHAVIAAHVVGPDGKVVAFEPNPEAFSMLKQNIDLNCLQNIRAVLAAVSNRNGLFRLVGSSHRSLGTGREASLNESGGIVTAVLNFPSALAALDIHEIDVLKLDVEGQESLVLEAFFESKLVHAQNIVFEFFPTESLNGTSPEGLLSLIVANGYELFTVRGSTYQIGDALPENNIWAHRDQ